MGRSIRLSNAEAVAAGLIDPAVAELVKSGSKPVSDLGGKAKRRKKKQSTGPRNPRHSRPAVHPRTSAGPAGSGRVRLGEDGLVESAEICFDLVPVPKERARVVTSPDTGATVSYTPQRTKHFTVEVEKVVRHVLEGRAPISGPVRLDMTFVMQVPGSWPKWKTQAALEGLVAPTGRPDMDNLEKALLDAFNRSLIDDDAFVVERHACKIYGALPGILIQVRKTLQAPVTAKRTLVEELRRNRNETKSEGEVS